MNYYERVDSRQAIQARVETLRMALGAQFHMEHAEGLRERLHDALVLEHDRALERVAETLRRDITDDNYPEVRLVLETVLAEVERMRRVVREKR